MHQFDLGGPIVQLVKCLKQFFGHVGNLEEPLGQVFAFNLGPGPPAFAVDNLFVGQHGHIDRIPVHGSVLAINQTRIKHVDEKGLLLAVIFRITGREHPRPIKAKAQRFHLRDHVVDVLVGPILGVATGRHRRVFGGHAKSIKSHWVQNVVTRRQFIARDHVAHRVVAHMADVDTA